MIPPTNPAENFGGFMFIKPVEFASEKSGVKSRVKKSDLKRLLEDYAGSLDPKHLGPMERGVGLMLIARVVRLLVELELKRLK